MKNRKRETFIFRGLGFPIKLVNVPMRKMVGEWALDIDFDHLKKTKDKDFRNFYHKLSLGKLAKSTNEKVGPLTINDFEDLKSA